MATGEGRSYGMPMVSPRFREINCDFGLRDFRAHLSKWLASLTSGLASRGLAAGER